MRWNLEYGVSLWAWLLLLLAACSTARAQQTEAEIEHLIKAASHLEQAGYGQLAAEVRQLTAGHDELLKQRLLEAKRAQIAGLQAEIEQLQLSQQPLDGAPKVTFRLKVIQLSMGKLRNFGLDLVSIRQLLESDSPTSLLDDSGDIVQFLELLETQGFAEVVASPTLVTADGRPAWFRIGESKSAVREAGVANGDHRTERPGVPQGVRFECTPTVLSDGRLRLKAAFCAANAQKGVFLRETERPVEDRPWRTGADQHKSGGSSNSVVALPLCDTAQRLPTEADSLKNGGDPKREQPLQPDSSSQEAGTSGRSDPNDTLVDMAYGQTLILACPSSVATTGGTQATLVLLQAEAAKSPGK